MAFKALYVNVFRDYDAKHYGALCAKVQTVIPTEALVPVGTELFHS
jgi:hypothetical protein